MIAMESRGRGEPGFKGFAVARFQCFGELVECGIRQLLRLSHFVVVQPLIHPLFSPKDIHGKYLLGIYLK